MAINLETMCRTLDELIADVEGNSDWDFYWSIRHKFKEYLGKDVEDAEMNNWRCKPLHEVKKTE